MAKIKIYTKTGDKGETSLFSGQRVLKDDPFIEALGSVDECNSAIGTALSLLPNDPQLHLTKKQLETIQHTLFDLGAAIATPLSQASASKVERTRFDQEGIEFLEKWIDQMEEQLPQLHTFILPGGHPAGAFLHLARSICRRAERDVIPLSRKADISKNVTIYLNRLSDYLFVCSRYVNHLCKQPEIFWTMHKHSSLLES
jgi:cob(I)alamin adenosyltransferase